MEKLNVDFPVGRFVGGSMTELRKTDHNNKPIAEDKWSFDFSVAFDKVNPDGSPGLIVPVMQQIVEYTKQCYAQQPAIVARVDQWWTTLDGMSMKIGDGDAPNKKGQYNDNTRGKFVVYFSTQFDVKTCDVNYQQINPAMIKRGWFVDLTGTVGPNMLLDHNAGVYMNPEWVRLIAEGDEIVGGRSAEDAFANRTAPAQLPAGARPVGSTPQATGAPGNGAPGNGAPGAAQPGQQPQQGLPGGNASAATQGAPAGSGMPGASQPAGGPGQQTTASPSDQHPAHYGAQTGMPGGG